MKACHFCGHPVAEGERIYRTSTCSSCGRDLKICLNCRFYSPGAHWDCQESISEPVRDKERANFCEFFQLGGSAAGGRPKDKSGEARDEFRRLFGSS